MAKGYGPSFGLPPRHVQRKPGVYDDSAMPKVTQALFGGGKVATDYQALSDGGYAFPRWKPYGAAPGEDEDNRFPFDDQPLADGGEVDGDYECSPAEKVAAEGVMSALGMKGDATKVAKALKAFWMIADSSPHEEG